VNPMLEGQEYGSTHLNVKRRYVIFGRLKSWYLIVDISTLSHICHHILCPSKRSQNALWSLLAKGYMYDLPLFVQRYYINIVNCKHSSILFFIRSSYGYTYGWARASSDQR
jgi:hypothetical protein